MTVPYVFGPLTGSAPPIKVLANHLDQNFASIFSGTGGPFAGIIVVNTGPPSSTDFSTSPVHIFSAEQTINTSGSSTIDGFNVNHSFSAGTGNRTGINAQLANVGPTAGTTFDNHNFYTGVFSNVFVQYNDGGTAPDPRGNWFGYGGIVELTANATHMFGVIGAEFDVAVQAGASTVEKVGLQVVTVNSDAVKGSTVDAAILISGDASISAQYDFGIVFGKPSSRWNVGGTLIGTYTTTNAMDVVNGIDFSAVTFSGFPIKLPNTTIDPNGKINTNDQISTTNAFGAIRLMQTQDLLGWRYTLNNDGTLRLQYSTDNFSTGPTALVWSTTGNAAFVGNISMGQTLELVSTFAGVQIMQTHGGIGFRWVLNNDGTMRMARTTDGFSTGTFPQVIDASSNTTFGGAVIVSQAGAMLQSNVGWTNGAGAQTGTLLNAPAAGNPTKWIPVNDNGTTRYIPAW